MILLCSYLLVYNNFRSLRKSYDKKWQREIVISKLFGNIDGKKSNIADGIMGFDTMLEDIRRGIIETEGWNNAWMLFDVFFERTKKYDRETSFTLLCHFCEIIFSVDKTKFKTAY